MPDYLAYFNGAFVPQSECRIHVGDSGFAFGHAATESTRTFRHEPFKLHQHVERLYLSMRTVQIDPQLSPEHLEEVTLEVLERNLPLLQPNEDVWLVHDVTGGPMITTIGAWRYGPATVVIRAFPAHFSRLPSGQPRRGVRPRVHAVQPLGNDTMVSPWREGRDVARMVQSATRISGLAVPMDVHRHPSARRGALD